MKGKVKIAVILAAGIMLLSSCGVSSDELRLEGIALLEQGKYEEAILKLDEALEAGNGKVSAEQFDILLYRAEAEYMTGDYEAARHTYEILLQVDGDKEIYHTLMDQVDAKLLLKDASEALNQNDLEKAAELLEQVKAAGLVTDKDVQFNEAVLLEKQSKWEEAYEAFRSYCEIYPNDEAARKELDFLKTRVAED